MIRKRGVICSGSFLLAKGAKAYLFRSMRNHPAALCWEIRKGFDKVDHLFI
jgi:hypothetical protein